MLPVHKYAGTVKQDPGSLEPKVSGRYLRRYMCVFRGSKPGSVIRKASCRERHNTCPEIGRLPLHHVLDKQVASQAPVLPFSLVVSSLTFVLHPHTSQ